VCRVQEVGDCKGRVLREVGLHRPIGVVMGKNGVSDRLHPS
jgi:hypothetical protein